MKDPASSPWGPFEPEVPTSVRGRLYYRSLDVLAWPIGVAAACLAVPLLALMVLGVIEYPDDGGPYSYGE